LRLRRDCSNHKEELGQLPSDATPSQTAHSLGTISIRSLIRSSGNTATAIQHHLCYRRLARTCFCSLLINYQRSQRQRTSPLPFAYNPQAYCQSWNGLDRSNQVSCVPARDWQSRKLPNHNRSGNVILTINQRDLRKIRGPC
jgi:hypothetical protein